MTGQLLIGNLDWEITLRADRRRVSGHHLERLSALGTMMRVFAEPGDVLWTPHPVDAARVPVIPGIPAVETLSGARPTGRWARVAPWAEAAWVDELRVDSIGCDAALVQRVHDRRFALDVAAALGHALPGAAVVEDVGGLESHLATGGADAGDGEWVVKATLSAAGRDRIRGERGRLPDDGRRTKIERLFAVHGPLMFEPWMPRVRDYGCAGWVTPTRAVGVQRPHTQSVDGYGRFRSLRIGERFRDADAVHEIARTVGARLAGLGYRGPFGIDAWTYRHADGERLHPLGEINARLTMGHIADALARRLRRDALELHVGPGALPPDAVPLLLATRTDPSSAWFSAAPGA